jgi:hypothetical protein
MPKRHWLVVMEVPPSWKYGTGTVRGVSITRRCSPSIGGPETAGRRAGPWSHENRGGGKRVRLAGIPAAAAGALGAPDAAAPDVTR